MWPPSSAPPRHGQNNLLDPAPDGQFMTPTWLQNQREQMGATRAPSWAAVDHMTSDIYLQERVVDDRESRAQLDRERAEASEAEKLAAAAHLASQRPEGPGFMGRLMELPPLGRNINEKQRARIMTRRRCKVKLQAERVLRGYLEGGNVRKRTDSRHPTRCPSNKEVHGHH